MTATPNTPALQALLERVEAGEWWDDLPRPAALHTDLCWKAFNGSIDAAKALIEAVCIDAHQVTVDWGPSGCGAKLVWWPDGLSDGREIASHGYDVDPARAMLGAVIRAMIADTEGVAIVTLPEPLALEKGLI